MQWAAGLGDSEPRPIGRSATFRFLADARGTVELEEGVLGSAGFRASAIDGAS